MSYKKDDNWICTCPQGKCTCGEAAGRDPSELQDPNKPSFVAEEGCTCKDLTCTCGVSEGVKFDQEKTRYDLIDPYALDILAQIYTYGAKKYQDNNWRKGMTWGRIFGAMMRHAWAFWRGEDNDPESGLPHLGHAMWQCATLLNYHKNNIGKDDRWKS